VNNPYDRTAQVREQYGEIDLPPTHDVGQEEREEMARADQREQALKQKTTGKALTESKAFAILAEYVEAQKTARLNHLLLTPITEANKDELNFMRGETAGLMLALKFAKAIAEGAEATLEVFTEERKANDGTQNLFKPGVRTTH
jgi:hypothetical protein